MDKRQKEAAGDGEAGCHGGIERDGLGGNQEAENGHKEKHDGGKGSR